MVVPLLLGLALPLPQIEIHDVARLVRRTPEGRAARFGSHLLLPTESGDPAAAFLPSGGPTGFLSTDVLHQLARRAAGPEEGLSIEFLQDALLVRGPAASQERVRALLDPLRESALGALEVELSLHEAADGELPPTILSVAEAEKALAARPPLARTVEIVAPGGVISLGRRTERSFLFDYDVEVAQRSEVADPVFGRALAGVGADLRVLPLAAGGVHLTLLADRGRILGVEPFETSAAGVGRLEVPRVAVEAVAASAVLRDREAAIFGLRRASMPGGAGFLVAVRARIVGGEPRSAGVRFVSCGFLADSGGRALPAFDDTLSLPSEEEGAEPETIPPTRFLEWLREETGPDRFDASLGSNGLAVAASDSLLVLGGLPDDLVARAAAMRDTLERGRSGGALLAFDLAPRGGAAADSARLSATVGRSCGAILGLESTRVSDYDVEIAERAVMADPIVVRDFDGVVLRALLLSVSKDRAVLEVDLRARIAAPAQRFEPLARFVGEVAGASAGRALVRRVVTLRAGEPALLAELDARDPSSPPLAATLTLQAVR